MGAREMQQALRATVPPTAAFTAAAPSKGLVPRAVLRRVAAARCLPTSGAGGGAGGSRRALLGGLLGAGAWLSSRGTATAATMTAEQVLTPWEALSALLKLTLLGTAWLGARGLPPGAGAAAQQVSRPCAVRALSLWLRRCARYPTAANQIPARSQPAWLKHGALLAAPAPPLQVLQDPRWPEQFPFRPEMFERYDESSDAIFYDQPRFVTHIDDGAIGALTK